jgi:GNAT superfamily N-acetyltransferase
VAVVRGYRFGVDDWEGLDQFMQDEAADMNLDEWDALELRSRLEDSVEPNSLGERTNLLLLALDGERVLGIAAIRRGASDRNQHVGMLRLHVRAENRSNGVGAKLLQRALWWADRNGITRTVALPYVRSAPVVHPRRRSVCRLLRAKGFALEGVQRNAARLLDGSFTDVAVMARVT